MVVRAVAVEIERLLRSRYRHFCVRVLSRQAANQFDFLVFGKFIGRVQNACIQEWDGNGD
jgi:hypothetical protein